MREGETDVRKERDALRRKLRDLDGPRKLPLLDNLGVASPCHEKWDDMVGDESARFCLKCEKNVYDLSSMTKLEAEALISGKEGKLCVRFYRRADGTILTADCPEGVSRKRRRSFAAGLLGASLLAGGGLAASELLSSKRCGSAVMGDVAVAAPPNEQGEMQILAMPTPSADPKSNPAPTAAPSADPRVLPPTMGKVTMGAAAPVHPPALPFTPQQKP
ncbi:hypothetical protein BH09MYX1_BH09MYX1_66680 [soil metagenome]